MEKKMLDLTDFFNEGTLQRIESNRIYKLCNVMHKYRKLNETAPFDAYMKHFHEEYAEVVLAVSKNNSIEDVKNELSDLMNMCTYLYQKLDEMEGLD